MKKVYLLFALSALFFSRANAQEMLGIANSNYAGVSGMHLNPSTIVDSRIKIDINLLSGGWSFDNDYLYIPKEKLAFFGFKNIGTRLSEKDADGNKQYLEYDTTSNKNITFASTLKGPSVAFAVKENYFAIHTAVRSMISIKDLHYAIAKFAYEDDGLHYAPQQNKTYNSGPLRIGFMSWGELGLTYGREIYNKKQDYFKGALTIKRLYGYSSAYVYGQNINFRIVEDTISSNSTNNSADTIFQVSADVRYGHAFYESNNKPGSNSTPTYNDMIIGHGWGFDIGLAYEYRPDYEKGTYDMDGKTLGNPEVNKYKLRIGASLLDIGGIKFEGDHVGDFNIQNRSSQWVGWDTINTLNTIDFDTTISNYFYGDPDKSNASDSYTMALPMAVSMQVDYKAWENIYINSTWVHGFKHNGPGVSRASIISLSPRYEKTWWEVSVPMSMYEYDVFRVGLALRFASFIIGSDKIGSLMGISDMGGMDFYLALKFSIAGSRIRDRDGDGVSDKRDVCPDVRGLLAFNGCPDSDGDGIEDSKDDCPQVKGLPKFRGCPDRDGDGVQDKEDQCPDVPGLQEFGGCPDTDDDKIIDSLDACPTVPGLLQFNGCPDADNDSIPDKDDDCPTVAGLIMFKGCPDTDLDSVPDKDDDCPFVKGPVSNKGCPVAEVAPEKKAPVVIALTEEEKEIIKKVFSNLEFETGKAVIRTSSFASLNELADLLKRKTAYNLNIDGHTDNVGGKVYNQKLSFNRATSVKKYLTDKGVDASRIFSAGYGLDHPIAPNSTPEGRQKNRRVEFTIVE